jgi:hypothetical protein
MFLETKLMFSTILILPIIMLIISIYESQVNRLRDLNNIPPVNYTLQKGIVGLIGLSTIMACLIIMLWRYA